MTKKHICLSLTLALVALPASLSVRADDTSKVQTLPTDDAATGGNNGDNGSPIPATSGNDGRLSSDSVSSLYSGSLPSMNHLNEMYNLPQVRKNPRHSSSCALDWARFRSLPVEKKTIGPSLTKLEANARKVGMSLPKLKRLLATFLKNQDSIPNQDYITVIDFDKAASKKRMFIVNLRTGAITAHQVAHGSGSGGAGGTPTRFSNVAGTRASSLGCSVATFDKSVRGRQLYDGHGRPILLFQGLEASNDQQCNRAIFMHPAWYVPAGGRSWGCPAVDPKEQKGIFSAIDNGGLVCSYKDGK